MPTDFILDAIQHMTTVIVTTNTRSHHGHILAVDDKGILFQYTNPPDAKIKSPAYLTWGYVDWIAHAA